VKGKTVWVWMVLLGGMMLSLFLLSCSKKEIKSEPITSKPSVSAEEEAEKAKKKVRITKEEGQEQKERTLTEEEARRLKEAAEKAKFEEEDIHFEYDQYILSDEAKRILEKKAQWLKQHAPAKVLIEGHCDERGSAEYNLALGQKRADAAMQYLITLGIKADRLSTISYGKERPLDPRSNEEAWAKNRRAHFVLKY
jgi:peptidoglycan-associated lipoprotein